MVGKKVVFGPNEEQFTITQWDYGTNQVGIQPSNAVLVDLLRLALVKRAPLLYLCARDLYGIPDAPHWEQLKHQ
jgi:hypothetical protein